MFFSLSWCFLSESLHRLNSLITTILARQIRHMSLPAIPINQYAITFERLCYQNQLFFVKSTVWCYNRFVNINIRLTWLKWECSQVRNLWLGKAAVVLLSGIRNWCVASYCWAINNNNRSRLDERIEPAVIVLWAKYGPQCRKGFWTSKNKFWMGHHKFDQA